MAGMPQLGETQFRVLVGVVAGLLVLGLIRLRFCGVPPLPPATARPEERAIVPREISASSEAHPSVYAARIERDSELHGLQPPATMKEMSAAFEHRVDSGVHVLVPDSGRTVDVAGLRLSAATRPIEGEPYPLLVLAIENTTDRDLAYQVTTRPSRGTRVCARKPQLVHNAIAVASRRTEVRAECIYKKGWKLEVRGVQTVVLPRLSYFYLSRVPPAQVGLEPRLTRGHSPPAGSMCNLVLPAGARNGLASGAIQWFDIVDFFARHPCDVFQFPPDYRAFSRDGERALPAVPN